MPRLPQVDCSRSAAAAVSVSNARRQYARCAAEGLRLALFVRTPPR